MPVIYFCLGGDFAFARDSAEVAKVRALAPGYQVEIGPSKNIDPALLKQIEIVFGSIDPACLSQMPQLKWLHLPSAGVDRYTDHSLYAGPVTLTNSRGIYGMPIAEHVLALFFALFRDIHTYVREMDKRIWNFRMPVTDFFGSTVGIIGMGDIGLALAERSKALGARVLAVKNTPSEKPDCVEELYFDAAGIDHVVKNSDFLALCLPATAATQNILTRERIFSMKPTAYLVNIGRGSAVDQDALIEALKQKRIAGAGLDVMTPEPLPQDSRLWGLENAILTSHNSGRSPTNVDRSYALFVRNLQAYFTGGALENVIDFERGY